MADKKADNRTNYSIIILSLSLIILLGLSLWLWGEDLFFRGSDKAAEKEIEEEPYVPSSRAEIFSISGKEAGHFVEVIFDPFEVNEGEEQKIIVTLKNLDEIQSLQANLEDGTGIQEKTFKQILVQEEKNQASYQIIWQPKNLESAKSYPGKLEYSTKSGETNEMTLFWHAK